MLPPAVDYYCRQFQANTFDPSRCSSCLRPDHMHLSTDNTTDAGQDSEHEWDADDGDDVFSEVTSNASSDDISGGWTYDWSLVHSLSPEWELNICDPDIQSSSPNTSNLPERVRSLSPERSCVTLRDMTRLDPSPHRDAERSWMDERRSRDRSRRPSESTGRREQESGYFSPDRRGNSERQMEEVSKRPYRYYERGHPLPSNYVLEPKACVPYRNVSLGMPSQRRNPETYMQEAWRSESPERYTYHSNFRQGRDSATNSPTRHSSVSPDRYKLIESSPTTHRRSSLSRTQTRSHSSHGSSQLPSHSPSRQPSSRSSPSRRRESFASRTVSPSRATPSHRRTDSLHSQRADYNAQKASSQDLRSLSQASNKHSLDSERLYRNLESISRRGSSAIQNNSYGGSQRSPGTRTAVNSSANTLSHNSRETSPPRNGYSSHIHSPQMERNSRESRRSPSQGSWQGSYHSLLSLPPSRGSTSRHQSKGPESQVLGGSLSHVANTEMDKGYEGNNIGVERSRSSVRRGMEALLLSEPKKAAVEVEEVGMTMEDYIVLADIPKIYLESEEELPGLRRRNQSPSPCRDQKLRTYRYHDETDIYGSRFECDERGRGRERGRDRREKCRDSDNGRSSRRQSTASLHTQGSDNQSGKHRSIKPKERSACERPQTQVLLLKGWMSRLDENGKWRKHWFVLDDTSLKYYRDSEAEESDDLDGEINLTSCVNVSDCEVEKNYGLQIQTKRAVFTLSATTSRIRRNWVKLLKQAIQNNAHQSDGSSEKEKPLSLRRSPCQPPARFTCDDSGYERTTATCTNTAANSHQADHHQTVDEDLDSDLPPASQREEGEGWDRDQVKRLEERNKWFEEGVPLSEMGSRWDSMELKRGRVPVPVIETMDSEVSRKWDEFETLSFREMSAQSLIGVQAYHSNAAQESQTLNDSQTNQTSPEEVKLDVTISENNRLSSSTNGVQSLQTNTAEALQKEALSLRKQVESIKKERAAMGIEVDSPCGPGAPCRARLEAMEVAHRKALQELQEKHVKEIRELEEQRDKMLKDNSEAAAKAMEALRASHRAELEREVEKASRLAGGAAHVETSRGHMPQADILHSELDVLSEKYSQTCLQLSRTEQNSKSRETELGRKEKELEQLRRENQELKAKLAEEISRMRYFITGQRSDAVTPGNTERSVSEVELLLRAKDNEVQYLKKEISCLQNEVQALTTEKNAALERYKEAYVELSDLRGRCQLEKGSLNEHLRLANAALQEGARNT